MGSNREARDEFRYHQKSIFPYRTAASTLAFCSASPPSISKRSFSSSTTTTSLHSAKSTPDDKNESLEESSLAAKLANSQFRNVVVLVGAGASVSAGIPDFRSPGTGLYDSLQKYNLPFPEAIFDLGYYTTNPHPFVELCQTIWPGQKHGPKPTLTHAFLKLLEEKKCLRRIYTQNIDGLESLAGVSTESLVECHGHFRSASCISCKEPMAANECLGFVLQGEPPRCHECTSYVKPDIVFFGEELPRRFQELVDQDVDECDLLLVIGTSLLVMPVAAIPQWISKDCPRVLLNRELVSDFRDRKSPGDIFMEGDCDVSVRRLCHLAGWEEELDDLHQKAQD